MSAYDLLSAFRFKVEIGGEEIGFKSVKGLKIAASFEPLQVGGVNDGPVLLPAPVKEFSKITFERGKYSSEHKKLPEPGAKISDVYVSALDEYDSPRAVYMLESPVVESIELGALDALSSEPLIETLTIAFRRLKET